MHLDSLQLKQFRSCESTTIKFRNDLTVLIGENGGGKSNVIDGIRLLTLPLGGRRDRFAEEEDIRRGADPKRFEIIGTYSGLSDTLKGLLISAVPDPVRDQAVFGIKYEAPSSTFPRGKATVWAGTGQEPEQGVSGLIRHVYLPPLRDAHRALGSASGTRVMALFRHFLPQDDEAEFLSAIDRGERPRVLDEINEHIDGALGLLTSGVRAQQASLDFVEETLADVARSLRFTLADRGLAPEDIRSSGLGFANLLYIATVAVELKKAKDADLTIFLVEEPEAHLHPQLQRLVLEYLLQHAQESYATRPPGDPEGRVQVIVTSHSPNLTAWVPPQHLVVVKQKADVDGRTRSTVALPVASLGIRDRTLRKLGRYLDVTRSALMFGERAVLVEGIAEALLLPVFARRCIAEADQDARQRFQGAVVIPIDGVDFEPYLEILLRPHSESCIAERVVVITDADPGAPGERGTRYLELAEAWGATDALSVFAGTETLEYDLMEADPGNALALKTAFLALHSNSGSDWEATVERAAETDRPAVFLDLLRSKRTRKGDFAHALAILLEDGTEFTVPSYLCNAIRALVEA